MAHMYKWKKFAAGSFWEFNYSPKYLDRLSEFDRRPMALFFEYDNTKKFLQCINFHWLTVHERDTLIIKIKKRFKIDDFWDFGKPIHGLNYMWVKRNYPRALIGWRRYFPRRVRNLRTRAWQWDPEEIKRDVIGTNTQKILGVTPEMIQKLAKRAAMERAKTRKSAVGAQRERAKTRVSSIKKKGAARQKTTKRRKKK